MKIKKNKIEKDKMKIKKNKKDKIKKKNTIGNKSFNSHFIKLFFATLIWIFLGTLLGYPEFSYINSFFQTIFLFLWSYFGHILAHYFSEFYPLNFINTHISIHHLKVKKFSKIIDIFFECINNFLGFYLLYIIQIIFRFKLFSIKIILYSAFLYIGFHIYYSISENIYHIQHHIDPNCNYSPEILDIIFNTKKYVKNYYHDIPLLEELIPAFISYLIIYIFFSKTYSQ